MGCMCSKAIIRSMSIRQELSHGFQNANLAWEDLLASNNGNDQRVSFLYSAKTRTNEPTASSFTLPATDDDLWTKYFVNASDLIPDIKRTSEAKSDPDFDGELGNYGKFTRSKSYQMSREKELSGLSTATAEGLNENKLDWRDKNLRGSRSFHTVEEYDALLERIHQSNKQNTGSFEDYYSTHQFDSLHDQNERIHQSNTQNTGSFEDYHSTHQFDSLHDQNGSGVLAEEFLNEKGNFNPVKGENTGESGWKRKAAAKGLKSLDVSAIESPAIAKLRHWKQAEGQVYSPGTYVTPKFGSYNDMKTKKTGEDGSENTVFSPELVAAFEDCVQQLQEDEDSILRHIDGYMRINNVNGEQSNLK